jgi:Lrp/AsnC family transcriptional regulator, leucine-responsive regulatory protein
LGKKVGVSREVAAYRTKKLMEEKTITDFYPIINIEKLGYVRNGCCMQLKGITLEKEKEFFLFLIKHPFVTYMGPVVGKWNVAFDIISKDKNHLVGILKEIVEEIQPYLENYIITNNFSEDEFYPMKLFGLKEKREIKHDNSKIELDLVDKKILSLLSTNSRTDYVELSSKLNLAANTVKYRIKRLESTGVIQGYTVLIDATKLGYEYYNLQIKLNPEAKDEELKNFLRSNPRVFYYYKYLGNEHWDLDIGILAKNSKDLRDIIMEFRNKFGTWIKIHDIYTNLEIMKANIAPKGIFS